jgi:probable phosphoglycerate mutase
MPTILFVRHSIAAVSPGDPGLTPAGRTLARAVAARLVDRGVSRLVSSPLRRSEETAVELATALGLTVEVDARLRERDNWGDVAGETRESFVERWNRCDLDRDHVPEHGRSARQAGTDLEAFVHDIACVRDAGTVLAVAHGGVIIDLLLNRHTPDQLATRNPDYRHMGHCAITEVRVDPAGWELEGLAVPA